MKWRRAYAHLFKVLTRDAGPCQMPGCRDRATVVIQWEIVGYGTMRAWYCDEHAPEEAIEA